MSTALRDLIQNPTAAELELVARYAMLDEDARRKRAFEAFAETGLPHRRMEAWKWSDIKASLKAVESPKGKSAVDPLAAEAEYIFRFSPTGFDYPDTLPDGVRMFAKPDVQAFAGAEDAPMGALATALSGGKKRPASLMIEVTGKVAPRLHFAFEGKGEGNFARVIFVIRPGAELSVSECYLGGAGLSAVLFEYGLQKEARLNRVIYQKGGTDEVMALTSLIHLDQSAEAVQTTLAFGAKMARLETRLVHQETAAKATLNAAYLAGEGLHADITTHVRHGARSCVTRQLTKGAVLAGGKGVFQGKFHVPRTAGQFTDADMQHQALLLEEGAEVYAKPELLIYADDVECAHGNTCGALDDNQLFYMRQRGIPEQQARALLTEAFVAEALEEADELEPLLRSEAQAWLKR